MKRETLREAALAAAITVLVAIGPFTPNEWAPSLLIGGLVAGTVFVLRVLWLRRVDEPRPDAPEQTAPGSPLRLAVLLGAVALYAIAFAPTARWLYWEWTRSVWANDHGLFMPFIIAYLVVTALRADRHPEAAESSPWGLPLFATGLLASAVDAVIGTRYLGMAGLLLTLPGLSLMLFGRRRTGLLAVPLSLSLLMIPIPYTLSTHLYLRHATAALVEPILSTLGFRLFREATVIHMDSGNFVVSDACSGIATLYASIAFALVLASMSRTRWRRVALLLAAPALALFANVIRVCGLILMSHFFGSWILETALHEATGVAAFIVVLAGLLALSRREVFRPRPA